MAAIGVKRAAAGVDTQTAKYMQEFVQRRMAAVYEAYKDSKASQGQPLKTAQEPARKSK